MATAPEGRRAGESLARPGGDRGCRATVTGCSQTQPRRLRYRRRTRLSSDRYGMLTECTLSLRPPPPEKNALQKFNAPVTAKDKPVQPVPCQSVAWGAGAFWNVMYEAPPGATGPKHPVPVNVFSTVDPRLQSMRICTLGWGATQPVAPVPVYPDGASAAGVAAQRVGAGRERVAATVTRQALVDVRARRARPGVARGASAAGETARRVHASRVRVAAAVVGQALVDVRAPGRAGATVPGRASTAGEAPAVFVQAVSGSQPPLLVAHSLTSRHPTRPVPVYPVGHAPQTTAPAAS
jgi:hypothetical protein